MAAKTKKYRAFIETKDGKMIKKSFDSREEARRFLREHFSDELHKGCWTD